MKKRIISFALVLAMMLSMTTVAFATDWESDIDVVRVAMVGDDAYASLDDAFVDQVETGAEYVSLSGDLTVKELELPPDAVLNLNGYTLTVEKLDSTATGAEIIDTTGGEGLLIVNGEYKFAENNPQLPIKDETAGGFRFFAVTVNSVGVTGKKGNSPKYWFQVKFDNFDKVNALLGNGTAVDIKVKLDVDGVHVEATAEDSFVAKWAETYEGNDGIYITATLVEANEIGATIVANPGVGANGVNITGKTL